MKYEIIFAPEAIEDYKRLTARERANIRDAIEKRLRYAPQQTSKSKVKRLRGVSRPQYRLRVDDLRVYYDVADGVVEIIAIVPKSRASEWLASFGEPES